MLAQLTGAIVSAIVLLSSLPAFGQQIGTILAVEKPGAFACRTSRAAQIQGADLAAAIANGTCIHVPRGQAVRIVHNPNPPESIKGGFFENLFGPSRVELVGNPASGHWYIAADSIGAIEHLTNKLDQLEKEFKTTKSRPRSSHRPLSELMPIAQRYLEVAGITDYKILPARPDDVEVAWEYTDGSRATLAMTRPESKISLGATLGQLIERDTAYCKGQYSSGYMPARYHLGSEIRKAFTACSDGSRSFANYYSVVALPSGAILRFGAGAAQSAIAPEAVPRAERLEDAALRYTTTRQK